MAQAAWKPAYDGRVSWTIKGVHEATREVVREASAEAEMVIGEWVDRALAQAAHEALHPSPPPATKDDVAAILAELAELRACVVALAQGGASAQALREVQASVQKLAEVKATTEALAEVQARVQKLAERTTGYDRPAVRHVMVEKKRPTRRSLPPRMTDEDPRES